MINQSWEADVSVTLSVTVTVYVSVSVRTAAFSTGKYHFSRSKSAFYLVYMPQISLKESLITHPKKVGFTDKYKVSQGLHCCHSLAFSSYGQPKLAL